MKKKKMTLQEKLYSRRIRKPPAVIYPLLANIWRLLVNKRLVVKFDFRIDPRQYKGPYIVVSNHASRLDYIYTGIAFLPHRLNYVAGYNEFFRSHLAFIFRLLQVIPKKNFVNDVYAVKEIARVIKSGGRVILFPEGMSSISGANQPCALGSGKLLKHFGVPVLYTKISGGYLTSTKYCLDERPGRVDVVIDELFTPEELSRLSADEIQQKLDSALYHDDYAWNMTARAQFDGHGQMARDMHTLLYWCPKCGREFTMHGCGDVISCTACGNGATVNGYYELSPLNDDCVIPKTPRAWFDMERERVKREIQEEGFMLRERVKLGVLPKYEYLKDQKTSEIVGEGELTLSRAGFTYEGTRDNEPFSFRIDPVDMPSFGMCTDVSRFYTFSGPGGEFLEFYPEHETVEKWFMAEEELHRLLGGKWRDFPEGARDSLDDMGNRM